MTSLLTTQVLLKGFAAVAKAAANLNHPNIVSVYDWGNSKAHISLLWNMSKVEVSPTFLKLRGRYPDRAAEIAVDVSAALGFMASKWSYSS